MKTIQNFCSELKRQRCCEEHHNRLKKLGALEQSMELPWPLGVAGEEAVGLELEVLAHMSSVGVEELGALLMLLRLTIALLMLDLWNRSV